MAGILDALKIISQELPKFASEMNAPFSKDGPPQSVMSGNSNTMVNNEKAINELLLTLGAGAIPILQKLRVLFFHSSIIMDLIKHSMN